MLVILTPGFGVRPPSSGLRATTYNLLVGMTQARSAAGAQQVGQLTRPGADARLSPWVISALCFEE